MGEARFTPRRLIAMNALIGFWRYSPALLITASRSTWAM